MNAPQKTPPLLSVRPLFDPGLTMAESVLAAVAGAVVAVFLLGVFLLILMNIIGLGAYISGGGLFTTLFVLGLAVSPALYFEVKKHAWSRTIYNFYPDHLEYQDYKFMLQRRKGRIRLRDIRDVFERAAPLQGRRALTSVYLVIPSFPSLIRRGMAGIRIPDVPESGHLREKIIELIEDSDRRYYTPAAPLVQEQTRV